MFYSFGAASSIRMQVSRPPFLKPQNSLVVFQHYDVTRGKSFSLFSLVRILFKAYQAISCHWSGRYWLLDVHWANFLFIADMGKMCRGTFFPTKPAAFSCLLTSDDAEPRGQPTIKSEPQGQPTIKSEPRKNPVKKERSECNVSCLRFKQFWQ